MLPSIRKINKYEIKSEDNPYKELNEFMKVQIEELKSQIKDLKTETADYKQSIKKKGSEISKLTTSVFTMKPSCILENKDKIKDEYCILYKKSTETIDGCEISHYPYYACRVQEDSIVGRLAD